MTKPITTIEIAQLVDGRWQVVVVRQGCEIDDDLERTFATWTQAVEYVTTLEVEG
jgi:hypothetical protein